MSHDCGWDVRCICSSKVSLWVNWISWRSLVCHQFEADRTTFAVGDITGSKTAVSFSDVGVSLRWHPYSLTGVGVAVGVRRCHWLTMTLIGVGAAAPTSMPQSPLRLLTTPAQHMESPPVAGNSLFSAANAGLGWCAKCVGLHEWVWCNCSNCVSSVCGLVQKLVICAAGCVRVGVDGLWFVVGGWVWHIVGEWVCYGVD